MTHASKSGVATFIAPDDKACLDDVRYLLSFLPAEQPGGARRSSRAATTRDRRTPELLDLIPASRQPALRHAQGRRGRRRRRRLLRVLPALGAEHRVRLRPARRPAGRHRRQPADVLRRRARHRGVGEGGPLRPHLRRVQHPARHLRRRARLPARRRPGVRRHHPPRRQAALRLLRGHRAPHPGHHPQGLRRRLRGHELEVDRRRPRLRLAVGRAGGHGRVRARSRSSTASEIAEAADPVARRAELVEEYTERWLNPYVAAERGYVDDVIDPADTRHKLIAGLELLRSKREELPQRKHGNMPL